jgi:uncharacterized membrane protein YcjF (UPF0283 family)
MEYLYPEESFCLLSLALAVAALALLSVRGWCWRGRKKGRARCRAMQRDRERVQQATHDELVQGVQGLMLRLQAIAEDIPSQDPARQQLEQLLDRADAMLLAAREAPGRSR